MKIQKQIANTAYQSKDFIQNYQELIRNVVIPYQYEILNDRIEGIEMSHAIQNFVNAGKTLRGDTDHDGFYGMVFQDSDLAKWIEAVAYSLALYPDEKLEATADAVIEAVAGAQDEDGYLNTYYTIKDREKRWTNLLEGHELYCSGHMMEAAVAYYEATGKKVLLEVMERNADHIYKIFVEEKREGYPGHPEVELALLKLARATGKDKYRELARHFIDIRGVDPEFYLKELEKRDWQVWGNNAKDSKYQQSDAPVRKLSDATGHSVRAVYLYTAMADLAAETGEKELMDACKRLWNSITRKRMYVTGGIGSTVLGEAFTEDYDLPNNTAYAETCASIGLMFFASRMLEGEINGEYTDVMERAFYNTVLAGMQLDGKKFFYVNPLEVLPGISGVAPTHRHTLPQRPAWYACACCPPNVSRLVSSFGKYAYGESADTAYCHLYASGEVQFENGMALSCETKYPYGFSVTYRITAGGGRLAVRIPGWSGNYSLTVNGQTAEGAVTKGYAYLDGVKAGDTIVLELDSAVKHVYASTKVAEDTGFVALQRGPLVYCVEGADNGEDVLSLSVAENGEVTALPFEKDLLSGTVRLTVQGYRTEASDMLYTTEKPGRKACDITAVPYYTWGNRGLHQMRVWLPEK